MCLALPAEVITTDADQETAIVSLGGVKKTISTALLDTVAPGQFVLVHVGYALNLVSQEEADATLKAMQEAGLMDEAIAGNLQEAPR
ncbi:MAG: HypC/HybG/HupF family hydrogenase formation chaperone [Rhizobiales bacterium]|nr:HypC/HybG/HupF family hydrogenase formation chaperone [Hyphomicrobiales bacterium]MBO6698201.1 HypC/HybG/HupF family hydrogenase formation chaperone [Hyphomicrobiales bacterium]MBO6735545.1 HypC/HybG/HupF family hydrogenase formation chaperone [Hyphomicrobiales bacterium]MBO6910647.1 HypC/HybG/HupF family hydrogenase formation chaperone [Hyphomicrobiales bacterium]MBO6956072.1 HypC/HybG/HupF family hydrogenase formation chaperone [Hyphomicrobiales bacterium]